MCVLACCTGYIADLLLCDGLPHHCLSRRADHLLAILSDDKTVRRKVKVSYGEGHILHSSSLTLVSSPPFLPPSSIPPSLPPSIFHSSLPPPSIFHSSLLLPPPSSLLPPPSFLFPPPSSLSSSLPPHPLVGGMGFALIVGLVYYGNVLSEAGGPGVVGLIYPGDSTLFFLTSGKSTSI